MVLYRFVMLLVVVGVMAGQVTPPRFKAEDVRPHGAAEVHPLRPGMLTWIFGSALAPFPGCGVENAMLPETYKRELCGTRVLVGGMEAKLIAVMEKQINLVLPAGEWEDEWVEVQVVREGVASVAVPVWFGSGRTLLSLAAPAYAGMPVWVRVEKPWGTGWVRYPFHTEPWDLGSGTFEVRFAGEELEPIRLPSYPMIGGGRVGLPHEPPEEHRHRIPLHVVYRFDRPGTYRVRYTEYRLGPDLREQVVHQQSEWADIEVLLSTTAQRRGWLEEMAAMRPEDAVELVSDYLPEVLASNGEEALRILGRYLDHPDQLVRYYAGYGLNYFDSGMLGRVLPGRKPMTGGVR